MGIASLHRPGNRSRTLIVGMASGLLLMLATFEASTAVSAAVLDVLPFDRANLFIVGFDDLYAEPLHRFLSSQAGLERPVQMIPLSWLRLVSVNGVPIERRPMSATHEIASKWMVSCVEGAQPPGGLAISSDLARLLEAHVGTRIDFAGRDRTVHTTVSEVRNLTPGEKIWSSFVVNCRDLEGQNLYHHAALRVQSAHLGEVRRMIHARYPTLAVISGPELMVITQVIAKEALVLIRVVAWYAIGAGWSVLFAVIAASRLTRFRELGILAALGAGRRKLIQIYTVEFAAIGFVAGVIGSLVACAFTLLVLAAVFGHPFLAFDWTSIAAAIPLTMAATVLAGWCSTYRLLGRKPIEALRDE
jgi:putative ABC transport system permease protein